MEIYVALSFVKRECEHHHKSIGNSVDGTLAQIGKKKYYSYIEQVLIRKNVTFTI
jgi:hypothetical protein